MGRKIVTDNTRIIHASIEGAMENSEKEYIYISIFWENHEAEFGHIGIFSYKDGSIEIDSEHMGKKFVKKVFNELVNKAKLRE